MQFAFLSQNKSTVVYFNQHLGAVQCKHTLKLHIFLINCGCWNLFPRDSNSSCNQGFAGYCSGHLLVFSCPEANQDAKLWPLNPFFNCGKNQEMVPQALETGCEPVLLAIEWDLIFLQNVKKC